MKKNIKTGAIYILALLIIIISGCNNSTGDNKHEISQVIKGDINETVSASGIVVPKKDKVAVTPRIMGTVEKIFFEENCVVKKDQVIMELDKTDLLKQLKQAEVNLNTAKIREEQANTTVALQPEEIRGKILQAETAYLTAKKQVEQVKVQLKAQEEQLEAKITQAEIALKAAKDNFNMVKNQSPIMASQGESGLTQAKSTFETAKNAYERQKNLYDQGFISKQDYDMASNKYEIAKTEYEIAQQKVDSMKVQDNQAVLAAGTQVEQAQEAVNLAKASLEQQKGASKKQLAVVQAQADQTLAALESAQSLNSQIILREQEAKAAAENVKQLEIVMEQLNDQIKNTQIKSPITGTVIKKQIAPGQNVSPALPVAVIANLETLVIEALVDEGDIGKIKEKQMVEVTTDNFPDEKFTGEIILVSSAASDMQSIQNMASYKVTIAIKNTKSLLKVGMNTYNDIHIAQKKAVLLVPNTSIHQVEGKDLVYVPQGNSYEKRAVEIGLSDNQNTEIISGLKEGDKIITGGIK